MNLRFRLLFLAVAAALVLFACDPPAKSPIPGLPPTLSARLPESPKDFGIGQALPPAQPGGTHTAGPTNPLKACGTPVTAFPTPHPANSEWVRRRLDAVIELYGLTEEGAALFRSLDVRQMRGEPGFFGSYGFHGWAGVGEARPIPVMHELSHSYWGGFPVEGRPGLSWDRPQGGGIPPALERYHDDTLVFMSQPPDEFELLRQRLRNLPDLHSGNLEPLLHNLEADMVYNTGGDLSLVPPVLRKYWSMALDPGPFGSWDQAVSWFRSLADSGRAAVSQYLGFEHLDLRDYRPPVPTERWPDDETGTMDVLAGEERQRLYDLAEQFDLLIGGPQADENFSFWRPYLRDKVRLHRKHPEYLASLDFPRARQLAAALDTVSKLEALPPREQADRLKSLITESPFLVNFLPAINNRALVDLFAGNPQLPEGATLQATASFVDRLSRFEGVVNGVLAAGREDSHRGASEMRRFLEQTNYAPKEDLRLFFELMREQDPATANRIFLDTEQAVVHGLLKQVPAQVRFILRPEQLLMKLDITASSSLPEMAAGTTMLVEETSGNYVIDEPFLDAMYSVIAARSEMQASDMAGILQHERFPLHGFIRRQPEAAVLVLGSEIRSAVDMVRDSDPVVSPPARIVHALVQAGPDFAAALVTGLDASGEEALVVASLGYIAYDAQRTKTAPGLEISLEQDARFLEALLANNGEEWLSERLGRVFSFFTGPESGRPAHFAFQFRATLLAAAEHLDDPAGRETIREITGRAYLEAEPPRLPQAPRRTTAMAPVT